jgi:hypothetical protein
MKLYDRLERRSNLCRQPYEILLRKRKHLFESAVFSIINAGVMVASVWMYLSALDDRRNMDWIDFMIMTKMDIEIKKEV